MNLKPQDIEVLKGLELLMAKINNEQVKEILNNTKVAYEANLSAIDELNHYISESPISESTEEQVNTEIKNLDGLIEEVQNELSRNYSEQYSKAHLNKDVKQVIKNLIPTIIVKKNLQHLLGEKEDYEKNLDIVKEAITGLYPIEDYMNTTGDEFIEEIRINGVKDINIVKDGLEIKTDREFNSLTDLGRFTDKLIRMSGQTAALNTSSPFVRLRIGETTRVSIMADPIATGDIKFNKEGKTYNIAIRRQRSKPFTREFLLERKSINPALEKLLLLGTKYKISGLWIGGTGTGKTAMMRYILANAIKPDTRVVVMAEIDELDLRQVDKNGKALNSVVVWELPSLTKEIYAEMKGFQGLVNASLTFTPETIVLQETKGAEIKDLMTLAASGHQVITTLHANDVKALMSRIVTMFIDAGIEMPVEQIIELLINAFPWVVNIRKYPDGSRKIASIAELINVDPITKVPVFHTIMEYEIQKTKNTIKNGKEVVEIQGDWVYNPYQTQSKEPSSLPPRTLELLKLGGITDEELTDLESTLKKAEVV